MSEKVYCNNCQNQGEYETTDFAGGTLYIPADVCLITKKTIDNYDCQKNEYTPCSVKNKNNNCKDFKHKADSNFFRF